MDDKLITIASYGNGALAHLAKAKLEAEGISCFIADEFTSSVNAAYTLAIGGVKVQVRESDAARAKELLEQDQGQVDPREKT